MKIMVLTVSTGGGHTATANSLVNIFEGMGAQCLLLDALKVTSSILDRAISRGYEIGSSKVSKPYSRLYYRMERRKGNSYRFSFSRTLMNLVYRPLYHRILEFKPDFIVSTHVFACMILDAVKRNTELCPKTLGIVTDFTVHPFWEDSLRLDYLALSDEAFANDAKKKGFSDSQLVVFGIPIKPEFAIPCDRKKTLTDNGLDPAAFTVLVMSGSMGYGKIEDSVALFDGMEDDFQMIVVCGNNKSAYEVLSKRTHRKKVALYGYANNVSELMGASDCVLTKPGGISTSEAMARELPMILVNPIPGQEDHNSQFLLEKGVALVESPSLSIDAALHKIISDPELKKSMTEATRRLKKPDSALNLCKFILDNA